MSIKKQYLKSKSTCKVTFRLTKKTAAGAATACLAGDFNNWKTDSTPMKALKNGDFTATINLPPGEYQFRYYVNGSQWITDDGADRYASSGFGDSQNGVVVV
ncbi:MAG: isoamylase early set domain-containing protein [Desulfosarcinaceae bacterium]